MGDVIDIWVTVLGSESGLEHIFAEYGSWLIMLFESDTFSFHYVEYTP